jgi:(p)ppGpp synthase/HD superfamily hydrolase
MNGRANPVPRGYSGQLDQALTVAALVHADQKRKGTSIPYLMHPVQVALILERHGSSEDLVTAALLHDALEDLDAGDRALQDRFRETFAELHGAPEDEQGFRERLQEFLLERFAVKVMRLVRGVTEQKKEEGVEIPWLVRKERQLAYFRQEADEDTVTLKAADALHNVQSILSDLAVHGLRMMDRFKATPEDTLWYYASVAIMVRQRLGEEAPLARELQEAVTELADRVTAKLEEARERIGSRLADLQRTSSVRPS